MEGFQMLIRLGITSIFLILLFTLSLFLPNTANSDELLSCGSNNTEIKIDTTTENNFIVGKNKEVVLLEGTCSQLKSGACGTGTCEKGWTCMDTGIQCLCSPPQ